METILSDIWIWVIKFIPNTDYIYASSAFMDVNMISIKISKHLKYIYAIFFLVKKVLQFYFGL